MSKLDRILRLSKEGKTAKEIAKITGTTKAYVYYVRSTNKNKSPPKKPITTPKQIHDDLKHHFVEFPKDYVVGSDLVHKPPHYTAGGIDFLDYAEAKNLTENAYLFNVVKYVSRAGKKVGSDPLEDLKKAQFYLNREIAIRERA